MEKEQSIEKMDNCKRYLVLDLDRKDIITQSHI